MKQSGASLIDRVTGGGPAIPPVLARSDRLWRGACAAGIAGLLAMLLAGWVQGTGTAAGWAMAVAGFALIWLAVARLIRSSYPHDRVGACNTVTLIRAALATALLPPLLAGTPGGWQVALIGAVVLLLDGVDGWAARRWRLVSDFGARFDMETDAFFALILSLHLVAGTAVGAEGLILGLARYVFLAAGVIWPWLAAPLPQRFRRKAICVVQLAVLIGLQLPQIPDDAAILLARLAAALVVWSFAVDILWLRERRV